jgi:hypothetical protein
MQQTDAVSAAWSSSGTWGRMIRREFVTLLGQRACRVALATRAQKPAD